MKYYYVFEKHYEIDDLEKLLTYLKEDRRHWCFAIFKDEISVQCYFNFGTKDTYLMHYHFYFNKRGYCDSICVWGKDGKGRHIEYYISIDLISYEELKNKIIDLL